MGKRQFDQFATHSLVACVLSAGVHAQENQSGPTEKPSVREVEITVVPGRPMFFPRKLTARPGEFLRFKVKNTGELMHNFVICDQSGAWKAVADAVIDLGDGAFAQDFNPGPPLVTRATPLLGRGEEAVLEWRAPEKRGVYSFLSSVPGHASSMRGEVAVLFPETLANLRYEYYEGKWADIPSFNEGKPNEPIESGELKSDRIDFSAVDVLREREEAREKTGVNVAIVVTADMRLPDMGNYEFALDSTNTPAKLTIPEVAEIEHNGKVDGTRFSRAEDVLDDGLYQVVLEVVGEGVLETPGVAWRGPNGAAALSVGSVDDFAWPDQYVIERTDAEPLAVSVPMPGASALALAVALPYGMHYCFDPETLCVRYAWEGNFLDARPAPDDGSGRLGGNCKPLGKTLLLGADSGFPLRIGNFASDGSDVRYLGHTSGSATNEPELIFKVGDHTVAQKVSVPLSGDTESLAVKYTFRIDPVPAPDVQIMFYADSREVEVTAPQGFTRNGVALFSMAKGEKEISVLLRPKASHAPE